MKKTELEQKDIDVLKSWIKDSKYKVYTTVKSVSRSGMSRTISCYICPENGKIINIDWWIAKLGLFNLNNDGYLKVGECGMDIGFNVVYSLGGTLYPDGFIPSEHGKYGRNSSSKDELDKDGGHSLHQIWL